MEGVGDVPVLRCGVACLVLLAWPGHPLWPPWLWALGLPLPLLRCRPSVELCCSGGSCPSLPLCLSASLPLCPSASLPISPALPFSPLALCPSARLPSLWRIQSGEADRRLPLRLTRARSSAPLSPLPCVTVLTTRVGTAPCPSVSSVDQSPRAVELRSAEGRRYGDCGRRWKAPLQLHGRSPHSRPRTAQLRVPAIQTATDENICTSSTTTQTAVE